MQSKIIDDRLTVGAQIRPADIQKLVARGYRSILCARCDGEQQGQPSFAEIEAAARAAGLEARYTPVRPGPIDREQASRFAAALRELPPPVYAYSASGGRSVMLASMNGRPWRA
jgi:sulfide:quinone oxidoreductase